MSKRFLAVLLALVMTLGLLPCRGAEPARIVLTTQDGTRIEGTADTTVTLRYREGTVDGSLFRWSAYRHNEFGYLSVSLSDDQVDWAKSQEGPATVEVDGQVFSGTVNCWVPTNWVLSFHPDGGDDSPAGQAIHAALYPPEEDVVYALSLDTGFSDVNENDWFAPYVDVCVEAGLMEGVGGGRFDPERSLTNRECAILALRLHQMGQGGDGTFDPAPADWDYFVLTLADGTVISQGYLGGEASGMDLHWTSIDRYAHRALGFYLNTEEDKARGLEMDFQPVTLTVSGAAYAGTLHLTTQRDILYFLPGEGVDDSPLRDGIPFQAGLGWWRDGWYYAQQNGLGELLGGDDDAPRWSFAYKIAKVTALPAINDIADNAVPDLDPRSVIDQDALGLYRAGILNGVDDQGTFAGYRTLTRAEAAAMLARVLKPELRLSFQLESAPREYTYTLTYLMDDPMEAYSHKGVTYPVLPLVTDDGINNGILTLDGELLPWPGGEPPMAIAFAGECLYMGFWFTLPDGSREARGGLIDKTGTFVVPLAAQQYNAIPIGNGRYLAQVGSSKSGLCSLWDSQGNVTELGSMDWQQAQALYHAEDYVVPHGLDVHPSYSYDGHYVDTSNQWVSQHFDWVGRLTEENTGFVGLEGKIYRIEFAR